MSLVPHRFLFRMLYPCPHIKRMPLPEKGPLLDLPSECRLDNFALMDSQTNFADVRIAWNEFGLGLHVEVRGKQQLPVGSPDRPRGSDGVTLWLDTRDARANHRGSRYCHQFHFLATGAGPEHDEPAFRGLLRELRAGPLRARLEQGQQPQQAGRGLEHAPSVPREADGSGPLSGELGRVASF